MSKIKSGFCHC